MSEIELKFCMEPDRIHAVERRLRRLPSSQSQLESIYFDTTESDLSRAGISLRLRREAGRWTQTLKTGATGAVEREEVSLEMVGPPDVGPPRLDLARLQGSRAGDQLDQVLGRAGASAALKQRWVVGVLRRSLDMSVLGARVELAFDRGTVAAGRAIWPICEVEYELKSGPVEALVECGLTGVLAHGFWLSTISKAMRGDRLARGDRFGPAVKATRARLMRSMSASQAFHAILGRCITHVTANASEIADGSRDPETIHQLRVALRRAKAAWTQLADAVGHDRKAWPAVLDLGFRELGRFRDDTDVLPVLEARLAASGSPAPDLRTSGKRPGDPVATVRSREFQAGILEMLRHSLQTEDPPGGRRSLGPVVALRLAKLFRQLRKASHRFDAMSPDQQHEVRKRVKKLRYLSEHARGLFPDARVRRFLTRIEPAQDALGEHIDLIVGRRQASTLTGEEAARVFNDAWFAQQLEQSKRSCRRALRRAARAEPFWTP